MELPQRLVIVVCVHWSVDNSRGHGVHADAAGGVLQCQSHAHSRHGRLRKHGQQSRRAGARLVRQDRRDVDDVSRILLPHLRDHLLRHEEETGHIGVHYQVIVVLGVLGEWLGN